MAKKQVNTRVKVLWRVRYAAKKEVLNLILFVRRITGLDTVALTVFIASAVVLALLPALLLKKAANGRATRIFCVVITVHNL